MLLHTKYDTYHVHTFNIYVAFSNVCIHVLEKTIYQTYYNQKIIITIISCTTCYALQSQMQRRMFIPMHIYM